MIMKTAMNQLFKSFLLVMLFLFANIAKTDAIEFDTSTGEEDIVFMSTDGEVNMGDSLSKSVEKRFKLVKDDAVQKRIADIGNKIADVCDRKDIIYHFKVIEDKDQEEPTINAFSLPGGYVYIFKDLYEKLKSDDELAGVIAHEVAHIVARHGVKRMQSAFGYNILMVLASQARTDGRTVGKAYAAINSLMLSYSREDEIFADKLSVKYTKKADYNPEGIIKILQMLWEIQRKEPRRQYRAGMTHPYLSIRLSKVKQEIYGKMDFTDYINIPTQTRR
jgi:beta-barrel assembly-enhancing protease